MTSCALYAWRFGYLESLSDSELSRVASQIMEPSGLLDVYSMLLQRAHIADQRCGEARFSQHIIREFLDCEDDVALRGILLVSVESEQSLRIQRAEPMPAWVTG